MTEIIRSGDCGNSPKNQLVEDISVALATADIDALLEIVTDDVVWSIVAGETSSGKIELADTVRRLRDSDLAALRIEHVLTHGRSGAVSGYVEFENGRRAFCDLYEFSTARGKEVKAIKSFRIEQS